MITLILIILCQLCILLLRTNTLWLNHYVPVPASQSKHNPVPSDAIHSSYPASKLYDGGGGGGGGGGGAAAKVLIVPGKVKTMIIKLRKTMIIMKERDPNDYECSVMTPGVEAGHHVMNNKALKALCLKRCLGLVT